MDQSTSLISTQEEIVCPRGNSNGNPILINIKEILRLESRTDEIQSLTPQKAGELMAVFIRAWRDLHKDVMVLTKERDDAERNCNKVRGRVILDEVPRILKERGLASSRSPSGSEDLREAILSQDESYQEASEKLQYITCVLELLKGKMRSFQMAYEAAKNILKENGNYMLNQHNPNLRINEDEFMNTMESISRRANE